MLFEKGQVWLKNGVRDFRIVNVDEECDEMHVFFYEAADYQDVSIEDFKSYVKKFNCAVLKG